MGWPTIYQCQSSGPSAPAITWNEDTSSRRRGPLSQARHPRMRKATSSSEYSGSNRGQPASSSRDAGQGWIRHGDRPRGLLRGPHGHGGYGRLRDVVQRPDGALYVTTSNCDSRGNCPAQKDVILRIDMDKVGGRGPSGRLQVSGIFSRWMHVVSRRPAQKRAVHAGKTHVNVLATARTDHKALFIKIVAMAHDHEIGTAREPLGGVATINIAEYSMRPGGSCMGSRA